jgi:large subunit ribosomal protein L30
VPAKAKRGSGQLKVKQVRSGIGHPARLRRTLRSIGLRHHQDVVVVADTPSIRGMLFQVRHLIEVTPVEEG